MEELADQFKKALGRIEISGKKRDCAVGQLMVGVKTDPFIRVAEGLLQCLQAGVKRLGILRLRAPQRVGRHPQEQGDGQICGNISSLGKLHSIHRKHVRGNRNQRPLEQSNNRHQQQKRDAQHDPTGDAVK